MFQSLLQSFPIQVLLEGLQLLFHLQLALQLVYVSIIYSLQCLMLLHYLEFCLSSHFLIFLKIISHFHLSILYFFQDMPLSFYNKSIVYIFTFRYIHVFKYIFVVSLGYTPESLYEACKLLSISMHCRRLINS